jgi:4'-phosphopantetheinyl transferase
VIFINWNEIQVTYELPRNEVAIWYAWLDQVDPELFQNILSADEINRADRFKNAEVANRFVTSRGILRMVLARYLHVNPASLNLSTTNYGKPFLTGLWSNSINFNISHSGNLMLIAISEDQKVGIDLEKIHHDIDSKSIASIVFSSEEIAYLSRSGYQPGDFYEIWTRKEAVLKATGLGFSYPSDRFSVISVESESYLPWILGEFTKGKHCYVIPFTPFNGYSGALATINQ